MKGKNEVRLEDAVAAVREEEVDLRAAEAARSRVWERLAAASPAVGAIGGCADVRALLPAHAQRTLPAARALIVEDHLRECAACRAALKGTESAIRPWRQSEAIAASRPYSWRQAIAAGAVLALGLAAYGGRNTLLGVPSGPRAEVQSITGMLYRVADRDQTPLQPGQSVGEGETVRTGHGSQAVLRLRDGSLVEMDERAELSVSARRRDTTVHLERGNVIVEAAQRRTGHLYVSADDYTVSVTGTVFTVSRGVKGARVAVLEGEVRVRQGGAESIVRPGQQHASSKNLSPVSIRDEIAWSRHASRHLKVLTELTALRKDWERVPMPGVRYESRLLRGVPANAAVYVAAPNYGESLAQAHALFEERVKQSAVLQEWWSRQGPRGRGPSLASMVSRLHRLSEYVGEEVVIAFTAAGKDQHVLYLAEMRTGGLQDFIERELFAGAPRQPRVQFVANVAAMPAGPADFFVLIRPDVVIASSDRATLRASAAAFDGKAAGVEGTPFGRRIADAYRDGTGLLVAAHPARLGTTERSAESLGISGFEYLIAERTEIDGRARNSAEMTFSGPRRGITSWLGSPAPMGTLEFVSPDATAAASFVVKNPAFMFDDMVGFHRDRSRALQELAKVESQLNVRLRDDLAAALGNEVTITFDGPVLPTPALKLIVEVNDPVRLEQTLEAMVTAAGREPGAPQIRFGHEQVNGRTYHALHVTHANKAPFEVHYTFADGYLVAAASRGHVMRALAVRQGGQSLARSSRLSALWPSDGHTHVSALLYQNLAAWAGPVAQGLESLAPEQRQALDSLASQVKPTLVYAYGEEDRIQVAGDLFNMDPSGLALPMLLGNMFEGPKGGAVRGRRQ